LTGVGGSVAFRGMANVLNNEKKQQILALGQLGWSLRRIQQATRVRRETISAAGTQSRANQFGRRKGLKTCDLRSTIARRSPFGGIRKGTVFSDSSSAAILRMRRVCCRIRCMLRRQRLLAARHKRTLLPKPHRRKCPAELRRQALRPFSLKGQAQSGSATPPGECLAITNRLRGESHLTLSALGAWRRTDCATRRAYVEWGTPRLCYLTVVRLWYFYAPAGT
jgi:hypothetical protein